MFNKKKKEETSSVTLEQKNPEDNIELEEEIKQIKEKIEEKSVELPKGYIYVHAFEVVDENTFKYVITSDLKLKPGLQVE